MKITIFQKWINATKPQLDPTNVSTIEVNDHEKKIYMANDGDPGIATLFYLKRCQTPGKMLHEYSIKDTLVGDNIMGRVMTPEYPSILHPPRGGDFNGTALV